MIRAIRVIRGLLRFEICGDSLADGCGEALLIIRAVQKRGLLRGGEKPQLDKNSGAGSLLQHTKILFVNADTPSVRRGAP